MIFDIFHSFPSAYPNNAECTWEITADNGYSIGLVFVDRYHLESSTNCEKDYVQVTMKWHSKEIFVIDLHRSTSFRICQMLLQFQNNLIRISRYLTY